jgi:uncharacterized protein (DUF427 family)
MAGPGPGYRKDPAHEVELLREGMRVKVLVEGEVIADSEDALTMRESDHAPVYYLPRRHVRMDRLVRSAHRTHCPYKGDASYFSLAGGRAIENAVWSYEDPYDEVGCIKDRLAFYADRVDTIVSE